MILITECNDVLTMEGWKRSTKLLKDVDYIAYLNENGNIGFKLLQNVFEIKGDKKVSTAFISNEDVEIYASADSELNIQYENDNKFASVKIKNIDKSKLFHIKKTNNGIIKKMNLPDFGISGEFDYGTNLNIYEDVKLNNIILELVKCGYAVDFTKISMNNKSEGYSIYYTLFDSFLTDLEKDFYKIEHGINMTLLGIKCVEGEDIHSICIQRGGKMTWVKY